MKRTLLIPVVSLLLLSYSCVSETATREKKGGTSWYKVENVISGDTITVNGVGRVKYIGIAAPKRSITGGEGEKFWKESLDRNRGLVEGKWVRFEMDRKRQDAFGRYLAYVFVQHDYTTEIFVNGEMLLLGLARLEEPDENTKYLRRLEALESRARAKHIGIWSD